MNNKSSVSTSNLANRIIHLVYSLLKMNISFTITSLPFLMAILLLSLDYKNISFFILGLLTVGPSILSLYKVIKKIQEDEATNIFKEYFSSFKDSVIDSKIWYVFWVWIGINIIDT